MERNIKNWASLLDDIATGLKGKKPGEPNPAHTPVSCIEVTLYCGKEKLKEMSLEFALEAIGSDLYFDEKDDWSDADRAEVRSI